MKKLPIGPFSKIRSHISNERDIFSLPTDIYIYIYIYIYIHIKI